MSTHTHISALLAMALAVCLAQPAFAQTANEGVRPPGDQTSRTIHEEMITTRTRQLDPNGHDGRRTRSESLLRPVIGVVLSPDEVAGVRVSGVTPSGGGAKAGLQPGDRIVTIRGKQVQGTSGDRRLRDAQKLLSGLSAGSAIRIGYVRNGKPDSVEVTPQIDQAVYILHDGSLLRAEGNVRMMRSQAGKLEVTADRIDNTRAPLAPEIRSEIIRIGPGTACKGKDCDMPALMSAFRWNGLNLATVDKQLGRYFGTDHGVLVLSSGDLDGLQAGDVIQRIDGKAVASPREAMAAMGDKPGGAKVSVNYLRDRKAGKVQVTVPKLAPLPLPPAPPAPPAPPEPPKAPAPPAPQAMSPGLPAPPVPPVAPLAPGAPDTTGTLA